MATKRITSTLAGLVVTLVLVATATAPGEQIPTAAPDADQDHQKYEEEGYAAAEAPRQEPDALEAAFPFESYRPGTTAVLRVWTASRGVTVRVFRVGPERQLTIGNNEMEGVPMNAARRIANLRSGATVAIELGDWPSGLYFAKLTSPGRVGFAPFVVRPKQLGEHRVAVVLPTRTWQAYNVRDDDGDGKGDTWYATQGQLQSRVGRPYLNRGVPPHFRQYDVRFLRWLHQTGRRVDVLSQSELEGTTGAKLAHAYDLLVFPGHHEYVTVNEYDAVEGFRDRGGNLIFLSANNFFWSIEVEGGIMTRGKKWRELGRPEASLLGVQYIGDDEGVHRGPWIVRPASAKSWIFDGVELRNGNEFSNAGIEIDAIAKSSPRGTRVVAAISDLFGPGMTAHMTYYETAAGAKVFSAGAFSLGGSIRQPPVQRLLANLWGRLGEREPQPTRRPTTVGNAPAGYAWPVRPFDRQHPVRGYFGDPRIGMTPHGMHSSFHFGIDISAPDGAPVYATLTGTVVLKSFRPEVVAIAAADGRTEFEYWHIIPAISEGAYAVAGKTLLGHISKGWGHVHFSDRRNGVYVNPLRPGALGPYADPTPPVIKSMRLERHDQGLSREALRGQVDLVAEAFDVTPLAVPKPWANRPVTPALVRWQLVDPAGATVVPWATAIDFRMYIPGADAYTKVYANWTRQNRAWSNGRYRIVLARGWDTTTLARGRYEIEISAADTQGNSSSRRFPVRIAN